MTLCGIEGENRIKKGDSSPKGMKMRIEMKRENGETSVQMLVFLMKSQINISCLLWSSCYWFWVFLKNSDNYTNKKNILPSTNIHYFLFNIFSLSRMNTKLSIILFFLKRVIIISGKEMYTMSCKTNTLKWMIGWKRRISKHTFWEVLKRFLRKKKQV